MEFVFVSMGRPVFLNQAPKALQSGDIQTIIL